MKKYQIEIKGKQFEIMQDDDGKFITPDYIKQQEQFGTALKPSFEPIIVARKPFKGSLVDNVIEYGVGGINVDECRVYGDDIEQLQKNWTNRTANAGFGNGMFGGPVVTKENMKEYTPTGRFPANTILTYDDTDYDEVCGGFPDTKGNANIRHNHNAGKTNNCYGKYGDCDTKGYEDSGSASRYFYCAKASKKDRDEGLNLFEEKIDCDRDEECYSANVPFNRSANARKNTHPTVKPTELMQYLVRLITPNNGIILDPFNGSGSTGKAVMYENKERNKNYKYIGIELTEEYLPIAKARIEYAITNNIAKEKENVDNKIEGQMSIFDY